MPCVERGHKQNTIFIEVVRHGARSWFSLCLESPTKMTAFPIETGGQRWRLPLAKSYEPERVKVTMFEAMEGIAKDHAANIDQYGVLTALEILEGMDRLYGVSMTFQSLNAALCGL